MWSLYVKIAMLTATNYQWVVSLTHVFRNYKLFPLAILFASVHIRHLCAKDLIQFCFNSLRRHDSLHLYRCKIWETPGYHLYTGVVL
jgi:hypothetical protein